jgi:hypothetical protein
MEWATQGLALLGIDRIRHYVCRTRYIHLLDHPSDEDQAEYACMWPRSFKAVQSCHNAAWRLTG